MLGYHVLPGDRWKGEHLCKELAHVHSKPREELHLDCAIQRTREVHFDRNTIVYPLKAVAEREPRSIECPTKIDGETVLDVPQTSADALEIEAHDAPQGAVLEPSSSSGYTGPIDGRVPGGYIIGDLH